MAYGDEVPLAIKELRRTNAAFRMYFDAVTSGRTVDLGKLWEAAGSPQAWPPRKWRRQFKRRFEGQVASRGGRLIATTKAANHYLTLMDPRVLEVLSAEATRFAREAPVELILMCETSGGAAMAKKELARQGMDNDKADKQLVARALEETAGLSDVDRETAVAKVQRAVAAVRVAGPGGG